MKTAMILTMLMIMASPCDANSLFIGISYNLDNHKPYVYLKANISKSYPTEINKFKFNEEHHGYAGLYLMGLGILTKARFVRIVGEALLIDDVIQHTLRINTPAHIFNDEVLKYGN